MSSRLRSFSNRAKSSSTHQKQKIQQNKGQPLETIPSEVVFKEIEINQYYEITVEIRNLSTKATRIRILQPSNPNFKVIYTMQPEIAPGLAMTAKVKYECKELKNQTEVIRIMSEQGYTVQLPVRVYKTQSQILFEPFVNMGFLKLGKQHIEMIAIKNSGKANGLVQFSHGHGALLSVEPKVLKISPMEESKIIVKYKPTQAGLFKGIINLKSDSILVKDTIDIHATAIEFARFVVDDKGNQTASFDFGTLLTGQESIIRAFVVNNSPKKMKFKSFFRKGYLSSVQQFSMVQTPTEIGCQQSERTMFLEPQTGQVQPFAEFEVKILCKSRITYKDRIYAKNFALSTPQQQGAITYMKNSSDFKPETIHEYSILVNIDDDEPLILQLKANAICPTIKLSQNTFKFGDCNNKEKREIGFEVENKSNLVKTEINFPKIPNFSISPNPYILKPLEKQEFKVVFQPKTIGKIDTTQLLLISKLYEIQMRCFGISTSATSKNKLTEQIVSSKDIPSPEHAVTMNQSRGKAFSLTEKSFSSKAKKQTEIESKMKLQFQNLTLNKGKYNQFLVDRRTERIQSQKQQNVQKKWSLYQSKLKDTGVASKLQQKFDDEGLPQNPPIDYEFETGIIETKMAKQHIGLPEAKQKLFVTRHVLDYQPIPTATTVTNNIVQKFQKDFREPPKKVFLQIPQNYNHKREVSQQLKAEQLSQIQVASNLIQFGQVHIKSISKGYFWIKNNNKKAISVQLIFKDQQLNQSYKKAQILSPNAQAGFEIVFYKDTLGDFRSTIKYLINSVHEFEMSVTAKCVPVLIDIDKPNLKFAYDENSVEMTTKETIKLTNNGNSDALFKITLGKDKLYIPAILEGKIPSKQTISIPISFTPPQLKSQKPEYVFNERLVIKVLDGPEVTVHCQSSFHDPKFTIKPLIQTNPTLCIGHCYQDILEIKNTSKYPIVLHINGKQINMEQKVKLAVEQVKKFKIKYASKQVGNFKIQIILQPRCGLPKVLTIPIKVISPQISFSQKQLDLGVLVVQGIIGQSTFTITNQSQIEIPLIFDLRPSTICYKNPAEIQNVIFKLLSNQQKLESITANNKIEFDTDKNARVVNGQNLAELQVNEQDLDNSESSEQENLHENQQELRRYRLIFVPHKTYTFSIEFNPTKIGAYNLPLPISIEGTNIQLNSPTIICEGIKPQFIFEPSLIDFKRKIVTKPERSYPKFVNIRVSNLDQGECIWEIKDDQIKKQGIFSIDRTSGVLQGNETIELRASFNPYTVGSYHHKIPLFIKTKSLPSPLKYIDIILKGTSSLPNLYFNKRQVIMPVVPLDIQTSSSFKILNDGYQNCNLKCQFIDDVADLGVKIILTQGNNIGITRQKLKVDLVWKYSKPISFCLKLQFIDDLNRSFIIPVSGTADNCIFTNYTYFLRNQNRFKIKTQGSLKLVQEPTQTLQRKNSAHSLRSNVTNKSILSYIGVNPISQNILSNTIDYINRYLNANLLLGTIKQFPLSIIETDGMQIFQILSFVSNKNANSFNWKYTPNPTDKPLTKVNKIFNQYNELIKMLKIQGAQLNHIRPEYLLSFNDLNFYLANLPEQKTKFYMPSLLKINPSLYNYLSMESWITLLYQIFKIYILSRVTVKNFKSHLPSARDIPKLYLESSNFASSHENIIFFWVEQAINQILLEERRLTNFDKDFKDGIAIAALLQKYSGLNVIKKMKMLCQTQEDYRENAQILCSGLSEIGMQSHILPKDIYNPLQRQMLLFILHLYVYLPFYTPKQEPVVFKCILGEEVMRSIELTNPSNKPVLYQVRYEGCEDFKIISEEKFRIEPKQVYKFQIKFVSRISAQVKGKIMFINLKQNSLTAAALVFQLHSEIVGRNSDRIWNISGILYEQVEFPIEVYNKFTHNEIVDFSISYETQYIFEKSKNKNQTEPLPKEQQIKVIYGKQDNIKIRKNGTATITLNYIPMSLYTTKTTIFFMNSIVGQFQHEIIASVQPPGIIAQIRPPMSLVVDMVANWEIQVNSKNQQINRAKKVIEGLKRNRKNTAVKEKLDVSFEPTIQTYHIEVPPNPYLSSKDSIQISEKPREQKQDIGTELQPQDSKLPLTISCKNPVYQFSTYILLFNKTKTDVRRYKVIFTIQPKPLKAILQMNVPARAQVTQNLPIVNNTEKDWAIKVNWMPDANKNGHYFFVPSTYLTNFTVKKNSIGNFPITFKPKWAHEAQAKLTLSNPLTLDFFQYEILGHGQQPLAEEHIEIKCQVKQQIRKQLIIKNPYIDRPVTFNIETDLLNCTCIKKLTIPSGGKQKFEFFVQPMLCGEYTGSITFFEEDGPQYIWYTISVITNYPQAFKTITIQSEIRQKVLVQIPVPYNNQQESQFQVIINGSGLSGDPTFPLKPNYNNTYILQYLPLEIGQFKGTICFVNPQIGQLLVQIDLKCNDKLPVTINNLKSPLGVSTIIYAELENPTKNKVNIKVTNTNPQIFVAKSYSFKLEPHEKRKVQIQYLPSSLQNIQSTEIIFISKQIGCWKYQISGIGTMPVPFPVYHVYNGLNQEHSDSVKFRNPFKYEIVVGVKLVQEETKSVFKLMNQNKTKFHIQTNGFLQIPFSFVPHACKRFQCKIMVMISEKIFWTFPIQGITQINSGKTLVHLNSQCRQTTSQFVQVGLEGVQLNSKINKFQYCFENVPAQFEKTVKKILLVEMMKDHLKHEKDMLEIEFIFKPIKPIKLSFDLLITKQQGSRWRYRVNLEGTDPEPDDIIEVQSNIMTTSTVSFKITNIDKISAPFKAKFTSDSAHQFSIEPKEGVLAPYGTKGTTFYVAFTPVEYGKQKKGKIIIETADMYWSYLIKGSLPKYVPPKGQASRIRTKSGIEKKI